MAGAEPDVSGDEAAERAGGPQHLPEGEAAGSTVEVHATVPPCPEAEDVSAESAPALREPALGDTPAAPGIAVPTPPDEMMEAHLRAD